MSTQTLPSTTRALVYTGPSTPLSLQSRPTPLPIAGTLIIRILKSLIEPASLEILSGQTPGLYIPTPSTPGTRAIGRIAALGPDSTSVTLNQLVILDPHVRARDDPAVQFLWGAGVFGGNPAAEKLMREEWSGGMWAEYVRAPMENCFALNEEKLMRGVENGGMGYEVSDLVGMLRYAVPYGGLRGIGVQAGETVIVAPATGIYSGAAVEVAAAMGARVIAASRNIEALKKLEARNPRVKAVQLKGNVEEDLAALKKCGSIDAYLDISPSAANESTHVRSCLMAVKQKGRVSLMGISMKDIPVPYVVTVINGLTIKGQYMYEREDVVALIGMVETGVLKLGKEGGEELVAEFGLEQFERALDVAGQHAGAGTKVLFSM